MIPRISQRLILRHLAETARKRLIKIKALEWRI